MKEEIWIPAKYIFKDNELDFTGYFEVSNLGNVRSVDRKITYSDGRVYFYKSQVMVQYKINSGYLVVDIRINGKRYKCLVHRLVLSSFLKDKWFKGAECNHIDSCKTNNILENLEWVTREENLNTKHHSKLQKQNQNNKIILQFDLNCEFIKEWLSAREIERELGFNRINITKCCKGKYKQAYGYIWIYKNAA